LFRSADIDARELRKQRLDESLFEDYAKQRVVNSFLFNMGRLQDNMGAKLFKELLMELREIDSPVVPMIDVIHRLEKLGIVESLETWDMLREIRNELTHDYSMDFDDRVRNVQRAMWAYGELRRIHAEIVSSLKRHGLL